MSDSFDDLASELRRLSDADRLRSLVPRQQDGVWLVGPDGRRLLNFGGNDYLGLAAEQPSSSCLKAGSGASALVCGWTTQHQTLADAIAEFESTEAAVLFPSGFAACSGTIATLASFQDLILSDELNHASLIDGCRLSRAHRIIYPHRNIEFIRDVLIQRRNEFRRAWIVTDGVFSMDGHVAPLQSLCDLADEYDATLVVDEAHGTGVLGESGSGVCEALGVKQRVPIRIGTLSKALGAQGGFVAGPQVIVDFLINRCRPLIYSTALSPQAVAATHRALTTIGEDVSRRTQVARLSREFRKQLLIESAELENGIPIVPVPVVSDDRAVEMSKGLAESGFFVPAIRPPTVPEGSARLRVSISAAHSQQNILDLVAAIKRFR